MTLAGGLAALPLLAAAFSNPIFWEDLADLDIRRVGSTYYYSSSTMHYSPGAPILRSYDLQNWEYIGHSVPTLDFGDSYSLVNGQAYVQGVWASFFDYHSSKNTWYWGGCIDFSKSYIYTASSVTGPWTRLATFNKVCVPPLFELYSMRLHSAITTAGSLSTMTARCTSHTFTTTTFGSRSCRPTPPAKSSRSKFTALRQLLVGGFFIDLTKTQADEPEWDRLSRGHPVLQAKRRLLHSRYASRDQRICSQVEQSLRNLHSQSPCEQRQAPHHRGKPPSRGSHRHSRRPVVLYGLHRCLSRRPDSCNGTNYLGIGRFSYFNCM